MAILANTVRPASSPKTTQVAISVSSWIAQSGAVNPHERKGYHRSYVRTLMSSIAQYIPQEEPQDQHAKKINVGTLEQLHSIPQRRSSRAARQHSFLPGHRLL